MFIFLFIFFISYLFLETNIDLGSTSIFMHLVTSNT